MKLLIISASICFLFILVRFALKQEYTMRKISPDKLVDYINVLLFRGSNGSYCVITKSKKIPFIQIEKKIIRKGNVEMHIMFPIAAWSEKYAEAVIQLLESDDSKHLLYSHTIKEAIDFIEINFADNSEKVVQFVQTVFKDVFDLDEAIPYKFLYSGISPYDVKIGF